MPLPYAHRECQYFCAYYTAQNLSQRKTFKVEQKATYHPKTAECHSALHDMAARYGMSLRILTLCKTAKQDTSIKDLACFPTDDLRKVVYILRVVILFTVSIETKVIIKKQKHFYRNKYK